MAHRLAYSCEELRSLYLGEALGVAAIAARLGCSPATVSNWLRRCDIPTRTGRFRAREVPRALLEQLYAEERLTLREIGARLGVSVGTVNNRRRAYGIPPRSGRSSPRALAQATAECGEG